jgi:hypothetical protein
MPNAIKYSTTGDTLSLKKGNIFFGVGDVGKGPSSTTAYYNGVTPPVGGYTIYSYNASQTSNLSFFTAINDASLITYTNGVSGQNFSTATQCLNWYATQSNYVCVNRDYEGIVTNGLVLNVDAGFTPSYTSSGTTWYDLSYGGNNGTLTNGPTFNSSNGGSIVFDGVDDYTTITLSPNSAGSICFWYYYNANTVQRLIMGNSSSMIYCGGGAGVGHWYNMSNDYSFNFNWSNTSQWLYMCATYQSTTNNSFYINGNLVYNSSSYSLTKGSTYNVAGGGSYTAQNCRFATISTYNRELSASEVLQNFNAQKSRFGL